MRSRCLCWHFGDCVVPIGWQMLPRLAKRLLLQIEDERVARVDVIMPQMGESIAEGTVSRWIRQVGDSV